MGFNQWICNQCSHQWDFASPEERALVPKHLTGGRIERFLEEFLAIKVVIKGEAEKIWNSCANAHQATSIAGNEDKPRVFAEQVDRWRDQLIGLQETLIIDRLLPLVVKYQISSNEQIWLFRACHEAWSPVNAGYVDWFTLAIRGQLYGAGPWVIPDWAWQLRGAWRDIAHFDVAPDQKASSLLNCLAYTLRDDLVVHRKESIAKAFLASKTARSSTGDADTAVAPAQTEEVSGSEASELFFAWWPSSSFPSPGWPDVVQQFKCAHRILTTNGFLIVADPENVTGDGKSWVLECKPTAKLPKDADPADLARQCLESEGVKADAVVQLDEADRTLHVSLSPPPQPITSVEVQEEPRTERRTKLLQKIYGFVPAKTLENAKHTILSRATAAVSGTLSQEVTGVCKRLFKIHYESPEEIDQAPEWQELNKLFCDACDTYVNIAMGNRRKIRGDLFVWVKEKTEADEKAISVQHFSCDANGYLVPYKASILADHYDTWSAMQHLGWLTNINVASGVFRSHIALAKSVALGNAAIRIASGSTSHLQPANQDTSATRARPQARSLPIRSSAPLSKFEATVGKLMIRARRSCSTKCLPLAEILKIAALLDDENLPVRGNLEREAARNMAAYNKQHPAVAIKSWRTALSHPLFRRAVRKRFSRAEEKYKKATPSIADPSAGTPRTTI